MWARAPRAMCSSPTASAAPDWARAHTGCRGWPAAPARRHDLGASLSPRATLVDALREPACCSGGRLPFAAPGLGLDLHRRPRHMLGGRLQPLPAPQLGVCAAARNELLVGA